MIGALENLHASTADSLRAAILSAKALQLTIPGVADVYQGTEALAVNLVDPDNRRPVDFDARAATLARLDGGKKPRTLDEEKTWVTAQALRLRRAHPEAFVGAAAGYQPLASSSGHAVVFSRNAGDEPCAVTVATRATRELERLGGWAEATVQLPEGSWRDTLTGTVVEGGATPLADLLATYPVALLERA